MEESEDNSEGEMELLQMGKMEESLNRIAAEEGKEEDMTETNSNAVIKGWVTWCRSHPFVKCVEADVPPGILPKNYRGILIDVKVGGKKRVPDDKIYLAHQDLREKVARGNCVLELHKIEKGRISSTKYVFLVFALKKFSGGLGDEDEGDNLSNWQKYFLKSISHSKTLISTEKANGEAAHFTSVKLCGHTYFCFGSKNVHMLTRHADDISKYVGSRYDFAHRVARAFHATYLDNPEIPDNKKQSLVAFLQETNYTGVAEMIQRENQHIVNLNYLKHPELKFICWTKPDLEGNFCGEDSYCSLPVNKCIDMAREFSLQTINYENVELKGDSKELTDIVEEYMEKIRNGHGYEGKVLYFLDQNNITIGLIKKKTAWYILLRALRQKTIVSSNMKKPSSIAEQCKAVAKRYNAIQIWLGFSDNYRDSWIKIATAFVLWTSTRKNGVHARVAFPVMFDEFLSENVKQKLEFDKLLKCVDLKTY